MTEYTNSAITIETLPAMRVACLRVVSRTPEDDGNVLIDRWVASQHIPGPIREFGFDTDVTAEEAKNGLRGYEMWRTVPDHIVQSDGVRIQDFPGGLYMVMTLDHCFEEPFTRIPESWMRLHDWVIHHEKYQSASHQWLEELLHVDYGRTLKLYHPVMPVPG